RCDAPIELLPDSHQCREWNEELDRGGHPQRVSHVGAISSQDEREDANSGDDERRLPEVIRHRTKGRGHHDQAFPFFSFFNLSSSCSASLTSSRVRLPDSIRCITTG